MYLIMVIQSYIIMTIEIKYTRKLNNVLNQNVKVTKLPRLLTFAISIIDNLCLLQQYKWNSIKL